MLLAAQISFAGTTIDEFAGSPSSSPDAFIRGEFSSEIQKSNLTDVRTGRFYVRQKSQDAFEDSKTTYNLFVGVPASEAPKLVKFDLPAGLTVETLLQNKVFTTNNPATEDIDLEKIYTDGNAFYAEYGEALYYKNGANFVKIPKSSSPNSLVAAAAAGDLSTSALSSIKTSVESQSQADAAADDIDNRFGYGTEIRKWSGWSLIAAGVGLAGGAYFYHAKISKDQDAIDQTNAFINDGRTADDDINDSSSWYKALNPDAYAQKLPGARLQLTHNENLKSDHSMLRNVLGVLSLGSIGSGIYLVSF